MINLKKTVLSNVWLTHLKLLNLPLLRLGRLSWMFLVVQYLLFNTKFHWLYSVVLSIVFYANPLLSFFVLLFFCPIMNPVHRGTTRPDVLQLILRDLFIILSQFLAGSCSVKMSQAFLDPSIDFHHTWKRQFKTPEMHLYFHSDV